MEMFKLAPTKKYNLLNPRKKICDNCKQFFNVKHGKVKCPFCGSRKIHYITGKRSNIEEIIIW